MILLIIIIAAIVLAFILIYNSLVVKRTRVDNGWAQIDVQLKRRYDLIPNLVETVKGYAAHEKEVLEKVTELRSRAMGAASPKEAAETNNMLTATLKTLFAVAENYPKLRANENFMMLQEELAGIENKIAYARQFYNDSVLAYNNNVERFPGNIIGNMFNFKEKPFFEVEEAEKKAVKVKF